MPAIIQPSGISTVDQPLGMPINVEPPGLPVVLQPPGMRLRTWISINHDRDLVDENAYEDVQQDIVNIFLYTFLCVVCSFVIIGLVFLVALKCIHQFRKV